VNKEKVVITGGAGFIGSHLSRRLAERGYDVVVFDNLFRGRYEYVEDLVSSGKASFVKGDVRDFDLVRQTIKGSKCVFHEAAVCINYSMAQPEESMDINIQGTHNVLKAALEGGVKKLIFSSSASVYGNPVYLPMGEDHPLNPITPYCVSKIADEYLLKMFSNRGLKYIALRNFNVYGLRQSVDAYYTSVILSFVKRIMNREPPMILGDGKQSMDFVNVSDVVNANLLAMESDVENEVFNVGSGESTSVKELAEMIIEIFGEDMKPIYHGETKVIVQRRQADISKIGKFLGFKPETKLKNGLDEIARDIVARPDYY
jgi:UDP-glucose 4-epimerase